MRFVTFRVRLRTQKIYLRLLTSPKTSNPVTTTAMSSLRLMWSVFSSQSLWRLQAIFDFTLVPHFCVLFQNLAYEIILTLGQAFEVAYQLALQARKSGHGSSTLPESFDSKPNKPVPKPRVNIRKSVSEHLEIHCGKIHPEWKRYSPSRWRASPYKNYFKQP